MNIEKVTSSTYRLTDRSSKINVGLVVTKDGALVVDTGSSPEAGREISQFIADVTSQPVAYVVNTHHHLEHSGGNLAFQVPVLSHVSCYHDMLREKKRLTLQGEVPPELKLPEVCFSDRGYLMLGSTFIEFIPVPGHTEGSLAVHLPAEGVLFGGDAFSVDPISADQDCDLPRWIESVLRIRSLGIQRIIPGRQETYGPEGLDALQSSLERIAGGLVREDSRLDVATGLLRFDSPIRRQGPAKGVANRRLGRLSSESSGG